jgi:hypothetical protein
MWYGHDVAILMANKYNVAMQKGRPVAHGTFDAWRQIEERIDLWEELHVVAS